jgi:diadenosine tetraphosphatase ApaH/serine/threonine PP2A family protein phosphatase
VVRLAILSDIHSNLEAFDVALSKVERLGVDRVVSCGDWVGYNADPNAVVDRVRSLAITSVMGNHDAVACGLEEPLLFNPVAREAILWTRETLSRKNREFLRGLPAQARVGDAVLLVHGSVVDRDQYLFEAQAAREEFEALERSYRPVMLAFFGHTHYPITFSRLCGGAEGRVETDAAARISLEDKRLYLVNGGSVGQPRDQDPRLSFVVADLREGWIERYRIPYPVEITARKVIDAGLPGFLARRLLAGY